jgi:hypothetical protein
LLELKIKAAIRRFEWSFMAFLLLRKTDLISSKAFDLFSSTWKLKTIQEELPRRAAPVFPIRFSLKKYVLMFSRLRKLPNYLITSEKT